MTKNNEIETVGCFEKVSLEAWLKSWEEMGYDMTSNEEAFVAAWEHIKLPYRTTDGSAGYDFYLPCSTSFGKIPDIVPTGIRVKIKSGWFLAIVPRSGLGMKYGVRLENTIGIIDSDYYHAANEGHIMAKIRANKVFCLKEGERFMQGIFMPYGLSENGNPDGEKRQGGFGSTGNS